MLFTAPLQVARALLIFVRAALFTLFPERRVFAQSPGNLYRLCSFVKRRLRKFPRSRCLRFSVLIETMLRRMHPSCLEYPLTNSLGAVGCPLEDTSVNSSLTVPSTFGRRSFRCLFGWLPSMRTLPSSVVASSAAPSVVSSPTPLGVV